MYNDQNQIIVNLRQKALESRQDTHLRYDFEDARRAKRALAVEPPRSYQPAHTISRVTSYRMRCALCGLGHRLARWGQYLEERFALPEVTVPQQEGTPPVATAKHG
jgi:hypothetical protein